MVLKLIDLKPWLLIVAIELIYITISRTIGYFIQNFTFEEELYKTINRIAITLIVLTLFKELIFQKKVVNFTQIKSSLFIFSTLLFLSIPLLEGYMSGVDKNFKIFFAFTSIFVALHEEIVYRAVIQNLLIKHLSAIKSILITSLIFTSYHIGSIDWYINLYIQIFLASIILGLIYYKTGSLLLVVILHTIYDALVTLTPLNIEKPIITYSEATYIMLFSLICFIFLFKNK